MQENCNVDKKARHKCKECDYSASNNGHLNRHVKSVHLKIERFKCMDCDHSTSQKWDLEKHTNLTHRKKPYKFYS